MVELGRAHSNASNTLIVPSLIHYLERELIKVGTSPVRRRDSMINLYARKSRTGAWVVLPISALVGWPPLLGGTHRKIGWSV